MNWSSACGKLILFGEHAVVYGRPALAVPLAGLRARAKAERSGGSESIIHARDLGRDLLPDTADASEPLAVILNLARHALGVTMPLAITIESEIPLASGFGSGAAVATAVVRAVAAACGTELEPARVSELVYESETLFHGTPSGIDNTVIAYEQPMRFERRVPPQPHSITPFKVAAPLTLLVANTGIPSPTKETVGDVRRGWQADPQKFETMFDAVGRIVEEAQQVLERGENERVGDLMMENQRVLEKLGVSSAAIERLIAVGLAAGADGGKLSGGGRGGNVIFSIRSEREGAIRRALEQAGVRHIFTTVVE